MFAAPPCPPARKTCVAVDRIRKLCRCSVRALRKVRAQRRWHDRCYLRRV